MFSKFLSTLSVLLFLAAFFLIGDHVDTGSFWNSAWALVAAGLAALAGSLHEWKKQDH